MRYSTLSQINQKTVKNLKVAWTYHTGDKGQMECTPIVVEGVMYVTTPSLKVAALDPATGRELWKYDPFRVVPFWPGAVNRGVAYWSDGQSGGKRRILHGTADGRLISIDARTGKPDPLFGNGGEVSLRAGLDRDLSEMAYGPTSAPAVFENIVILGFLNGEGPGPAAPGDIRAFDVRSGKELWRFHTVPRPGEFGRETWSGDSWKDRGGANAWGGFTVDEKRGWVFAGLGSAAFDHYGGDRKGSNLFANCVLVLNARTGERIWHFQTVRHDLWDYDLPVYPNLITLSRGEAVAQVTKTGFVYLFDRVTGHPLFDVQERLAPASDVPGEAAWPIQVVPSKPPPFSRQFLGPDDLTNISKKAHDYALRQFRSVSTGPIFTPPALRGSITFPGFHGGATWSGASFDPETGILYVNSNNLPYLTTLVPAVAGKGYRYYFVSGSIPFYSWMPSTMWNFWERVYLHMRASIDSAKFVDEEGYPAVKPPWGNLSAIDLNKGEIVWQVTLGEFPELTARGIPPTGTENLGGTIVTAGGLVFIGGTKDEKFRAFDKVTGTLLWEYKLDAAGNATPCTYSVAGRQFVVIAAGGSGRLQTKFGDSFVAFVLPQ